MSNFTTRVELYGSPSAKDYENLHDAMKNAGFSRQITIEKKTYWLPHAEYSIITTAEISDIKNKATKAAATVWKDLAVLVTKSEIPRDFYNLKAAN